MEENAANLLSLERSKAALLIQGAIDRTDIYQTAEAQIDKLIRDHLETIERGIRALRKDEIGEEAAAAEQLRGSKTDEQYSEEFANRRREREKLREELQEKERAILEEKKKIERAKKREEDRIKEIEEEKRREGREARRKAEREAEKERERYRERDRDRDRTRDRERDNDRGRDREHERVSEDDRRRRDSRQDIFESTSKPKLSKDEVERLEQEALAELMNDGKRMRRRSRQAELEIDKSLAPPPRKTVTASAIKPISRDPQPKPADNRKETPVIMADGDGIKGNSPRPTDEFKHFDWDKRNRHEDFEQRSGSKDGDHDRDGRRRRESKDHDNKRDRIRDDRSRRSSKDRARRHESRDREDRRRRESKDRGDGRPSDRDDRHDRDRSGSPDHRQSVKSPRRTAERDLTADPVRRPRGRTPPRREHKTAEELKLEAAKQREQEAKAYMATLAEAKEKGLPMPFENPKTTNNFVKPNWGGHREEFPISRKRDADTAGLGSPASARKREPGFSRDRDSESSRKDSRARSRSRTSTKRVERSTSPVNIDRYVPGGGSSRRRSSVTARSPPRKRDKSRDRDRDRERDRDRDNDKDRHRGADSRRERDFPRDSNRYQRKSGYSASHDRNEVSRSSRRHSRSRSRSRRRDRSTDREYEKGRARSKSRSPARKHESNRREKSRSRSRDRRETTRRHRSRSRSRDHVRERHRDSRRESAID